jgi:hypothetical protein
MVFFLSIPVILVWLLNVIPLVYAQFFIIGNFEGFQYFLTIIVWTAFHALLIYQLQKTQSFNGVLGRFKKNIPSSKIVLLIVLAGSLHSLIFIYNNIDLSNLISIAAFTEKYRNGYFSGSFVHTFTIFYVSPLVIVLRILFTDKLDIFLILSLTISIIMFLLFGFRILLLIYVFSFVFKFVFSRGVKSIFLLILMLVLIMPFFKMYLNDERSYLDLTVQPLLRAKTYATLSPPDLANVQNIQCLLPFYRRICDLDSEGFKYNLFSESKNVHFFFPNLSKYSGVALPGTVYLYNILGFFSIFPLFLISILLAIVFLKIHSTSLFVSLSSFFAYYSIAGFLFEDIYFIGRMDIIIFFIGILLIILNLKNIAKGKFYA